MALRLAVALNGYGREDDSVGPRSVLGWHDMAGLARLAEELGYERIFTPEIRGWESFVSLSGMAAETSKIGLATGIVPVERRDPMTLAMGAMSLQERSAGRFVLGVGSSSSIERTRHRVETLRAALSDTDGSIETDWARAARGGVPIFLAALGPRMVGLAGEVADGIILNICTPERVARAREAVGDRDGFTVAVYVRGCLSHVDEEGRAALRTALRRYAGFPPYRRQFEAMGLDPGDADTLVAATCVLGDRGAAVARLREYAEAGADLVVIYPVAAGEAVSSLSGTMMALAPDPAVA